MGCEMVYRIPGDDLLMDAMVNVLLRNKSISSQREFAALVAWELNRNSAEGEDGYRVSGDRIRRLALRKKLVDLDIGYRDSTDGMPDACPVCGRDLGEITNSTLDGGTVVIIKKCGDCGYSASARHVMPSRYGFNMRAKRLSDIQALRLNRMHRAREHLLMACGILDSMIEGHILAHDAEKASAKIRAICEGNETPDTIANIIRALEADEGEPVWCRPLASVKNSDRKDI